ncbi:TonB-dependent receptor [Massilia forsythiae]|uniref:TonB-dependent receptor n=1 Tax=Massilia forsythiae TaxID=2728020 RepID=A0A7Z2VWA7_9BURK|nr:TonB-dependent receptor [Massilia forsythiae]QJE00330.1 TonB-dependent receptor [Massilia forsythiae]
MEIRMKHTARAVALALLHVGAASAQQQVGAADVAAAAAPGDGLRMERIVVTGTASGTSKLKSSVSVSTLEADTIASLAPTSAADVLRAIPGVRSESSGGEGNANITVRGVPISAGGARYVQIQEDGLPVLQFGDFNFATPDSFVKIDGALDHVEAVRGGSASTLATNSPGGIINFISKDGSQAGGSIGLSRGLDYDSTRVDFDYGMPLSPKDRFFVAGFYRYGEGIRNTGVKEERGGQVRANYTHEFDGGFLRVSFKHLDDQSPTALPVPVTTRNGHIAEIAGIDPREAAFYSPYWVKDVTLTKGNGKASSDVNDGLSVKSNALGLEGSYDLGNGWTVSDRFRKADNSGRFIGVFPADNGTVGNYTFATGPNAGQAYRGRAINAVVFNTSIDDAGNTLNDARLSKTFRLDGAKLNLTAGWYASQQKLGLTWNFNQYLLQASGDQPALLRTASTTPGLVGAAFGGCCSRAVDMKYRTNSPYANLGWEQGAVNVDASVRRDRQHADGSANIAASAVAYQAATVQRVDYEIGHTSYSVGANWRATPALALFARTSEGVAFNADRILFGTPLDGSAPVNINTVRQLEGGVKWRSGGFSSFLTLFRARTSETNFEATTRLSTANSYDAKGAELEAAWRVGDFNLTGGLTLTDAEITATAPGGEANIGHTPRRQARAVYQLAPSYELGQARFGLTVVGTGKSWGDDANTLVLPGYAVVHAFLNYQLTPKIGLSVSANNLFNKIGYTEIESDGHAARAVTGRAVKAGVKYAF